MDIDPTAAGGAAAGLVALAWVGAGAAAATLPYRTSARALHRRTRLVQALTWFGLAAAGGAATGAAVGAFAGELEAGALTVLALLATAAAGLAAPRLARLRATAAAFGSAPGAPTPPALRAAAAHPLLNTPVHAVGLVAAVTAVELGGAAPLPGGGRTAAVLALAIGLLALRHSLRHSRHAARAVRPDGRWHPPSWRPGRGTAPLAAGVSPAGRPC